jgi:glycosyltransferase involved in cell wall biosynthesis
MVDIAAVNSCSTFGGREQWTSVLLKALAERGHRILFYCRPEVAVHARGYGIETHPIRLGGDLQLHHAQRFANLLARSTPRTLLIAHYPKIWLAGLAARRAGVSRVVTRIDLSSYHARNAKYRFALARLVDASVANADAMRRRIASQFPELSPDRLVTIYDGVEPPPGAGEAKTLRAQLGIPECAFVAGTVARLHWRKRHDLVIRAVATLPDRIHLVIAGDGPERETLAGLALEAGAASRVHLLGHRHDVGAVLGALDLYVLASDHEGMSNAMLEALAMGVPVISTPVSGADEALEPDDRAISPGEIVDWNANVLASRILWYSQNPEAREVMARAAAERARTRFGFQRMIEQWETLLVPA